MGRKNPHTGDDYWWVYIDSPLLFLISIVIIVTTSIWAIILVRNKRLSVFKLFTPFTLFGICIYLSTIADEETAIFLVLTLIFLAIALIMKLLNLESRR